MSDIGHEQTDALIGKLEKRIAREYRQAAKEAEEKLADYLRRFEIKDEKWRLMVSHGEKTAKEYKAWRTSQIMVGKRWEALREQLAAEYHNANVIARSTVLGYMPESYALNHNFATYQIEEIGRVDTSYTLYSRETVERILREDPDMLQPPGKNIRERIAAGKDIAWQSKQIQSVTLQSIIQGESIPHMAQRIARTMGEINHKSTIRYARTAMTEAQNAGRQAAYKRAEALGVKIKRRWLATLDNRTRHAHRQLDGQERSTDEPFDVDGFKIMYPGDPSADASLIWNCRCTTRAVVAGWDRKSALLQSDETIGGQTYAEWKEGHSKPSRIDKQEKIASIMERKAIDDLYR